MPESGLSQKQLRKSFNAQTAPVIAEQLGFTQLVGKTYSKRFAYFADDDRLLIVAGEQEGPDVELALAYGLTYRGDHRLVLALPATHANATLQRSAWFKAEAQPEVRLHDGTAVVGPAVARSQTETLQQLQTPLPGNPPAEEPPEA